MEEINFDDNNFILYLDNMIDFSLEKELPGELEISENYTDIPWKYEESQNFCVWSVNDDDNHSINSVKQESQFIIKDEAIQIIEDNAHYGEVGFNEKSNHMNSSFEDVLRKYKEDGIIIEAIEEVTPPLSNDEKIFLDIISEEPPKISCGLCGRSFSKKCYLIQHTNQKHTDKKFKCTRCNKKFFHGMALENHISKHNNENKSFKCMVEGCKKAYVFKADLKVHFLNNHKKDLKKNICECGKSFSRKDHLAKHKRTHMKKVFKL